MGIETHHGHKETRMPRGGYRGGHRPLKYGEPTINTAFRIPISLKEKLVAYAEAQGKKPTDLLVEWIESLPQTPSQ